MRWKQPASAGVLGPWEPLGLAGMRWEPGSCWDCWDCLGVAWTHGEALETQCLPWEMFETFLILPQSPYRDRPVLGRLRCLQEPKLRRLYKLCCKPLQKQRLGSK